MINMSELKKKVFTDYDSPAFILMERVINEMGKREIEPYYIMGIHIPTACENDNKTWFDIEIGKKYIGINTVSRHNGTAANVTVEIAVSEKTSKLSAKRLCIVKVPKDASDKVINKRIDKILEIL